MKTERLALHFLGNISLLVASLLVAELALQIGSAFVVEVNRLTVSSRYIPDPEFGIIGNPQWSDHDARGFRNFATLTSATTVTLGDSHTYGTRVELEDSWPSRLSSLLDHPVYNMGMPGLGPARNLENMATATALNPTLVVFGLYFGNDFYDVFEFSKENGLLGQYGDASELRSIWELEDRNTLAEERGFLSSIRQDSSAQDRTGFFSTVRRWLSIHSRLYGLLRTAKNELARFTEGPEVINVLLGNDFDEATKSLSEEQLLFASAYEGPKWKTIFTSPYRYKTMDDTDPRIRLGIEITKQMLNQMHLRASEAGARYVVLLLPTKEYVFWPRVEHMEQHALLAELVSKEDGIRNEIKQFMQMHEIEFIDPAPELRASETQPYFGSGDGHPNALGHTIIAQKVSEFARANLNFQNDTP